MNNRPETGHDNVAAKKNAPEAPILGKTAENYQTVFPKGARIGGKELTFPYFFQPWRPKGTQGCPKERRVTKSTPTWTQNTPKSLQNGPRSVAT